MRRNIIFAITFYIAILCIPQNVMAQSYSPLAGDIYREEGFATWKAQELDGTVTASTEINNSTLFTAAHRSLPYGTFLIVTNKINNRQVAVRVNDRGPFDTSLCIELSKAAAEHIDLLSTGTAPVIIESFPSNYLKPPPDPLAPVGSYESQSSTIYAPEPDPLPESTAQTPAFPYPPVTVNVYPSAQPPETPPQIPTQHQSPFPPQQPQAPTQYQGQPPYPQQPPQGPTQYQGQPPYPQQPPQGPTQYQGQPPYPQQSPQGPTQYQAQPPYPQQPQYQAQPQYPQQPQYQAQPQYPQQPQYQAQPQYPQQPQYQAQPQYPQQPQYQAQPQYPPQYQAQPPQPQYQYPPQPQYQPPQSAYPFPAPILPPMQMPPYQETYSPLPPVQPALESYPPPAPAVRLIPSINPLPGTTYRLQVGSYKAPRNAVDAFEKLKGAGLSPAYEQNGEFYRVVLAGIPGTEVQSVVDKLGRAGFREAIIRVEH